MTYTPDQQRLDQAIRNLINSLDPNLWVDSAHLNPLHGALALSNATKAVSVITEMIQDPQSMVDKGILRSVIDQLVSASRSLATTAFTDAINAHGNGDQINQCLTELSSADSNAADHNVDYTVNNFANAIEHYQNAWQHAQQALSH